MNSGAGKAARVRRGAVFLPRPKGTGKKTAGTPFYSDISV